MELAIPLIALGSLYMSYRQPSEIQPQNTSSSSSVSKQSSSKQNTSSSKKEGFTTRYEDRRPVSLYQKNQTILNDERNSPLYQKTQSEIVDGDNIQPNYPPITYLATEQSIPPPSSLYDYPSQQDATGKYINQTVYENEINSGTRKGNELPSIYSLSGKVLNNEEFIHHNMVPFMGRKIAGPLYDDKYAENILDNLAGTGSQMFRKVEQAPLFDPSENIQYPNGSPDSSDFYQSRVVPGMSRNNTKPWESIHVGPGLDAGYSSNGTGGFNSGMEHRDKWLPKTVDELRVDTNPKMEYSLLGHQGPAQAPVKDVGIIGEIDRKLPDSFFINSPDRWFTTTGAQKGETLRSDQPTGIIKRTTTDTNYVGPAGNMDKPSVLSKNNYEASKKKPSVMQPILGASKTTKGNPITHQNIQNNYVAKSTNRQNQNKNERIYGNSFGGIIGSVLAPIVDILKPSRKEEMVSNMRIYGDPGSKVQAEPYFNPQDKPKTTTKETTLYTPRSYINNQEGTYVNTNTCLPVTNRMQSSTYVAGPAGGYSTSYGEKSTESAYNQTCNNIKSQSVTSRTPVGSMSLFNNNINICMSKSDVSQEDFYTGPANSDIKLPPSTNTYGHIVLPNKSLETEKDIKFTEERLNPSILQAFYNNPYTHSLSSVA